ncbi:MAG: hypothetical protein R2838_04925 [Caldilineaceae bacterium]
MPPGMPPPKPPMPPRFPLLDLFFAMILPVLEIEGENVMRMRET